MHGGASTRQLTRQVEKVGLLAIHVENPWCSILHLGGSKHRHCTLWELVGESRPTLRILQRGDAVSDWPYSSQSTRPFPVQLIYAYVLQVRGCGDEFHATVVRI